MMIINIGVRVNSKIFYQDGSGKLVHCFKKNTNSCFVFLPFRLIFSDQNSRNLFLFLLLNFSFAFVELFYGMWTNSLGLISDSFHMFFDCTALIAGLVASVIMKWKANDKFSFG